ncbi:extracellular solute-binding protein [Paenibacillus chungangensis]|uniref:Extracellular solute-binding protein n=1 Tax=Paenibacillus chungangensis TaxID=696535 RepID=A0ABW3HQ65_9BACL
MKRVTFKSSLLGMLILLLLILTACSNSSSNGGNQSPNDNISNEINDNKGEDPSLPQEAMTFSVWSWINGALSSAVKDYNDIIPHQVLQEKTGVELEWVHPAVGTEQENFNLMVSGNELTDVILWGGLYKGGPEAAIKDKVILPLNDLIDQHAPNFKKLMEQYPEIRKQISTDDGEIYILPTVTPDNSIRSPHGAMIRADWLEKVGMSTPETVDDWYAVLKAFKESDPNGNGEADELPFVAHKRYQPGALSGLEFPGFIVGAWGITTDFYQVDGKVKYGPMEPEYKEYLETLHIWYKEGLIDPEFATTDKKSLDAKVTGEQAGAFLGWASSGLGAYLEAMKERNPAFKLVPVTTPVLKSGDKPLLGYQSPVFGGLGYVITTNAKDPAAIVRWIDYRFSEEGHLLANFGVEGESYEIKDGNPVYTDKITNNPDYSISQALGLYTLRMTQSPFINDKDAYMQTLIFPEQKEALTEWSKPSNERQIPSVHPSTEESKQYGTIMSNVYTYMDEMFIKFVMGTESFSNYDAFVTNLEKLGIQEAIDIKQSALDRYNARN